MPIMIANGRRIDQRTTMAQTGGIAWFQRHLELNGFAPLLIDGSDPAAYAWSILTMSRSLTQQFQSIRRGQAQYPVTLPYTIAETVKGFGFPGAGTNAAHNLPLVDNPSQSATARESFNQGAASLYCAQAELMQAITVLANHHQQNRPLEKDHCLRNLQITPVMLPNVPAVALGAYHSPMQHIDEWFCELVKVNPGRRFRVGNPDEMRSNRLNRTLDVLKHRVTEPETGIAESSLGGVITALNEEAVISAALANKQGISLVASYEAFAVKMLGAMRQEILFTRKLRETGRAINWSGLPVIVSSHTWENGKNEQSHQDPTLAEAWLGEMSDIAPVLFPFDANTAAESLSSVYQRAGSIAVLVIPKGKVHSVCTAAQAQLALAQGAITLQHDAQAAVQLLAIGAYQLAAVLRASTRLRERGVSCSVVAILEPGRFRLARDSVEAACIHSDDILNSIIPDCSHRIVVCHTHFEPIAGVLRRLDTGNARTVFLGYRNRGGTLDVFGMQYANRQTWAHIVADVAGIIGKPGLGQFLDAKEIAALNGHAVPDCLR